MKVLYYAYQILISPLLLLLTLLTALATIVGCRVGNAAFWSYYPGKLWSQAMIRLLFLPVKVEGRENMDPQQSYIFIPNHQGAFDIFLIYGHLNRNFKWMMKQQLEKIPFVGYACKKSHQIFVDKRGPSKIRKTYENAREILKEGYSVTVFPEGARSFTGHMAHFRKGAFALADELQLPVVPLTINGSFDILPRMKGFNFINWHPMKLTIHQAIYPIGQGPENVDATMRQAYDSVMSSLEPQYQGFVENPDQ